MVDSNENVGQNSKEGVDSVWKYHEYHIKIVGVVSNLLVGKHGEDKEEASGGSQ